MYLSCPASSHWPPVRSQDCSLLLLLLIAAVVGVRARQKGQARQRMKAIKSPSKCCSAAEGKGRAALCSQSARPQICSKLFSVSTASLSLQRTLDNNAQKCCSTGSYGDVPLAMQNFVVEAPVQCRQHTAGQLEWDVLGVGQAMVDFAASVDESMLRSLNVLKGGRRVISVPERAQVMQLLEGCNSQVSAGGSLANTLVGLGQLAAAQERSSSSSSSSANPATSSRSSTGNVRVGMTGCVGGSDALGEFARAQLQAAGVDVVAAGPTSNATGVVMVFTTPDAQRSFLSSFSSEDSLHMSQQLQDATASARLLLIEGYMWETQGAADAIPALVRYARSVGTLVALTAGDVGVVERHGAKVLEAIAAGVDIWFGNEAEAAALVQHLHAQQAQQQQAQAALEQQQQQQQGAMSPDDLEDEERDFTVLQLERLGSSAANNKAAGSSSSGFPASPASSCSSSGQQLNGMDAALQLAAACPMVVVTDGSRGSYITALGQLVVVPPYWSTKPPVDTCGAGDAYAAGLLYGFLCGLDLHSMGHLAAKTASAVISKHGPQLSPEDAEWAVAGLQKQGRSGTAAAAAGTQQTAGAGAPPGASNVKAAVGGGGSAAANAASLDRNGGGWGQ